MLIVGGGAVVDVVGVDVVDVGVVVFFGRSLDGLFFDVFEFSGDPKSAFAVVHHSTHRLDSTVTPNLDDLTLQGGKEERERDGKKIGFVFMETHPHKLKKSPRTVE